ncbi:survival protein sure-like phosphatase/nucleotidase [Podospora didyma]|uniref:Survival protein sure-like phosphatase/nucleotidase n=1 Tax=Podospora didyma TaxID=330526 RepID=A0AAE0TZZ5_9PEZI|nr:survival protein sure-like phosphatase/nucleotidase [Podospora didyma]
MRSASILAASISLVAIAQCLNVLITNDDGFGTANIRELYKQMTAHGHDCYIVASATNQAGVGPRLEFTDIPKLTADAEWAIVKAGAPSLGTDPIDNHIFYYNGTPAAQVIVALDYILPKFATFTTPDLVLSGPNAGWNLDQFPYTIAGAIGASYVAIERDIPAIAFFSGNNVPMPYFWVNATTRAGLQDPATITARLATSLVQSVIDKSAGSRVLPKGYGMSVNLPFITSYTSEQCTNPPFVLTRGSENVTSNKLRYNTKIGIFDRSQSTAAADDQCSSGICNLPGEKDVVTTGCMSAVTVFAVDYNAAYTRECFNVSDVTAIVPIIVQLNGTKPLVGGLGPNASVIGNVTVSPPLATPLGPLPPMPTVASMGVNTQWPLSIFVIGLGVVVFFL